MPHDLPVDPLAPEALLLRRRSFLIGAGAVAGLALVPACSLFGDDVETIDYGEGPSQHGELFLPGGDGPFPTAVVIHGGSWTTEVSAEATRPIARWLADHGWAAWNLEYRRVGEEGGGFPGTLEDVGAGIDHLAVLADEGRPIDTDRVLAIGHSAGGQLALWSAARSGLADGEPGAAPEVGITGVASLAGVTDLAAATNVDALAAQTRDFLGGGPDEQPARYQIASPIERVALGVPQLVAHGSQDTTVPMFMGVSYAIAAREAGDEVDLLELDQTNHFTFLDPDSSAWQEVSRRLDSLVPAATP